MLDNGRKFLLDLLEPIGDATSLEAVDAACTRLVEWLGLPFFVVLVWIHPPGRANAEFVIGNLPPEWRAPFIRRQQVWLSARQTPAGNVVLPFVWADALHPEPNAALAAPNLHGASAIAMVSGCHAAMMSILGPDALPHRGYARDRIISHLYLLTSVTLSAWQRLADPPKAEPRPARALLTRRERECLTLAAEGHTSGMLAAQLGISKRTAAFHIDRAIRKLNVHSRAAAVKQAIFLGEIAPDFLDAR
jgi:DNA-binding CsgD family transcriptional regulator